ncbi:MAG: thymidine phosphorylase [Planctomycetaceae bacterium]|nr:thymidine phosphorylase [Planctomycetaceae bacterium]
MNIAEIIAWKRDGGDLSARQIAWVVDKFARGEIADAQMSALAMAIFFQDMTIEETIELTSSMLHSGRPLTWPESDRPKVDKHSTGGIGDKISLPLAPIWAALGIDVPMISGRGLGPTGGTLDKLESIPGFQVNLSREAMVKVVQEVGCVIVSASADFAPADKKLYALRDVTGTVASIPLITASILSKKLSEGLDALVMDIKWGSGAFMKQRAKALELAHRIVAVARHLGTPTRAILTDMNQPIGRMIGNACEVQESLEILEGGGPADTRELTMVLATHGLLSVGLESQWGAAWRLVQSVLDNGTAREKFAAMVQAQGGDLKQFRRTFERRPWLSERTGWIQRFDCEKFGYAIIEMGGGRKQAIDQLDYRCGIELLVEVGSHIERGQPLLNILDHPQPSPRVWEILEQAICVSEEPPLVSSGDAPWMLVEQNEIE